MSHSVANPGGGLHAPAMSVGTWSSSECGAAGWPTTIVELRGNIRQDEVDQLVLPLLRLGPEGESLQVTVLPENASAYITGVMVQCAPKNLLTTRRVILESSQVDPIIKEKLPSIYFLTASGQGPLRTRHSLGEFVPAHFVMLRDYKQGLTEHRDNVAWQGPQAMIHLVKTSDGWTNTFFRDVEGQRHIVLRVLGGMVISATAGLLHVLSHGVLPDDNQYTLMIRGALRDEMRRAFHKLLVDAVLAVAAQQDLLTLMSSMGADVTQSVLGNGCRAALSPTYKDEVRGPRARGFSLLEGISGNAGRRTGRSAELPLVYLYFTEMGGTENSVVFLGQCNALSSAADAPLYVSQFLTSLISMVLGKCVYFPCC